MSIIITNDTSFELNEKYTELIHKTVAECLTHEKCPFDVEVSMIFVNNEEIRKMNKEHRDIDTPTDVLSFPLLEYDDPSDFSFVDEVDDSEYFNLDTNELVLGDIVISIEKVIEQAEAYNHSLERELGFLIVHSMLHLFGYDHIDEYESEQMFKIQENILEKVGLVR
ncbi:MAG: rRNA maturation RNase YbeY [Firmicutes bacterium HGW-Firmicutes-1]|jgi:probable rRNA maturation factor|nr:MAG: rRNA maturation RNase YbeY [Firmicutes bacterium HGW-Firmicutes-1]